MAKSIAVLPPGALPEDKVIYDREKNTKTVISYESEDDGEYQVTKEYTIQHIKVPAVVAKRKQWKKFGDAKNDPPGPNSANTYPGEVVKIQYIANKLLEVGRQTEDTAGVKPLKPTQAVTCRTCKGPHFSSQCPFRSEMEAIRSVVESAVGSNTQGPDAMTKAAVQEIAQEVNSNRYIPPSLRAAAAAGGTLPQRTREEHISVRVTNLPEDTSERDLRELFERFGNIVRVYSAIDKKTNKSRGFAFISYRTKEEAAAAIYSSNGMHYGNLVLKVDWAQPSANN